MSQKAPFDPKDFLDFKNAEAFPPPTHISEKLIGQVHRDLNPSAWRVFAKISQIHFVVGLITLSVCPQFGFRFMGSDAGLMGIFMSLGPFGCMIACGAFFLGMSILIASLFLKPEELRQLKNNSFLEVSALALLSLGFFIMVDVAEIVFGFAVAWLFGSLMAGMAVIELVFAIRAKHLILGHKR